MARQRTSIGFKLAVRGDSGVGGLVAPLPCAAYFGKLVILFGCSLPQQEPCAAYFGKLVILFGCSLPQQEPCAAYFGKLVILFGCSLPQQV